MARSAETPDPITSLRNPLMRRVARLERDPAARAREGVYLAWGWNVVEEALQEPGGVERFLIGAKLSRGPAARGLVRRALQSAVPVTPVKEKLLDDLFPGAGQQPLLVLARCRIASPEAMLGGSGAPILLVADRIQDPGNLGTLVRLGEAAGIAGLAIVPGTVDPYHPRAVRASSGSILRVPVARIAGPADLWVPGRPRVRIIATLSSGGAPCHEVDLKGPLALVMGNEGEGVSREWIEGAQARTTISLGASVQSLNVALAASILLYEASRQRRSAGTPG